MVGDEKMVFSGTGVNKHITFKELNVIVHMLNVIMHLDLLADAGISMDVSWEQRPKLIINKMGNFEFEDPQQVYSCCIRFYELEPFAVKEITKTRFYIREE